ncbi:hypothetical protein GALMADRAFT_209069 [Galerina marginata CBS 339.88]|uniref:Uncharacterized protein n=1 Tax=Galerina marginata (strain CBS 339.88) TaxID=685588 RepID=A0A067TFF4_GALM3|nr:hypothetical protein GALMADRAFT_209069 [Galerina marginata CBS 339.88]
MEPFTIAPTCEPPSVYVIEVPHKDHKSTTDSQPFPEPYETQRLRRYLLAEQDLAETFQRCQQGSTSYELQIEALRKATSVLNSHVTDAGQRVTKLRKLLVDRATEPSVYQSLQRQRWMEERRQRATEHLSKVLQHHLSTLSSQPEAHPQGSSSNPGPSLKADMNLVRFFETSSRRRLVPRSRNRSRVPVSSRPQLDNAVEIPRLHNHKAIIPLLLSVPKYQPPFLQERGHLVAHPSAALVTSPISPQPPEISTASALTPSFHLGPISEESGSKLSVQTSTPAMDASSDNGTAIIWRNAPRSAKDILDGLVVEIPDYAVDLLAGFDLTVSTSTSIPPLPNFSRASSSRTTFMPNTLRPPKTTPPPVHASPSRKRISALFSLPEGLSSRRGISMDAPPQKRLSTHPTQPFHEESTRPFSVSFSELPSSDSGGSHEPEDDDKVLSRLRRRMSALRRH